MLARGLGLKTFAFHQIPADAWDGFGPGDMVAIHWPHEAEFVQKLNTYGFEVFTLVRHPLDVLISILHFCLYEKETAKWLLGKGGDESSLWGAMPTSQPFLDYCQSERARALLSVSVDWANHPGARVCKYEDLLKYGGAELRRVCGPWDQPEIPWETIVKETDLDSMRKQQPAGVVTNHFWKGQAGLWRQFLTQREVDQVAPALEPFWKPFGYDLEADPLLSRAQAERNWVGMVGPKLSQSLENLKHLTHRLELAEPTPVERSPAPTPAQVDTHPNRRNPPGKRAWLKVRSWFRVGGFLIR